METTITQFEKALIEVLEQGYGEVVLRVVVQGGKISYHTITKSSTYKKIDLAPEKEYA